MKTIALFAPNGTPSLIMAGDNKSAYVSVKEVAQHFGVSRYTVLRWGRDGLIPRLKVGHRTVKFDLAAVIEAVQKFNPTPNK